MTPQQLRMFQLIEYALDNVHDLCEMLVDGKDGRIENLKDAICEIGFLNYELKREYDSIPSGDAHKDSPA